MAEGGDFETHGLFIPQLLLSVITINSIKFVGQIIDFKKKSV